MNRISQTLGILTLGGIVTLIYKHVYTTVPEQPTINNPEKAITIEREREKDQHSNSENNNSYKCQNENCEKSFDTEHGRNVHEGKVHN